MAGAAASVTATDGGPSFTSGPAQGTVFPLLQTTLASDNAGIRPATAVNSAGGTAAVSNGALSITIGGFTGLPNNAGYSYLDWTRVGYWSTGGIWDYLEDPGGLHRGVFVTGYETPAAAMPSTGTATYSGYVHGSVYYPVAQGSGTLPCNCAELFLAGNASFNANFGARTVSGTLTEIYAGPLWDPSEGARWNDVAFNSTITGNGFSGITNATSAGTGPAGLSASATGTVEGRFFGPAAQEAGAVWTLFDGVKSAIGTLTGERP